MQARLVLLVVVACKSSTPQPSEPHAAPAPPFELHNAEAAAADAGVVDAPPKEIRARIIELEIVGSSGTYVVVSAGSDDGIVKSWKACLLDALLNCRPDSDLVLVRIQKQRSRLQTKFSPSQLQQVTGVRLWAP